MHVPTLFNLILPPHGKEASQLGVPSRATLLYDLSLLNITNEMNWDLKRKKSPPPARPLQNEHGVDIIYPVSATENKKQEHENGGGDGETKGGRKLRFLFRN
jgi:hypothetical protein